MAVEAENRDIEGNAQADAQKALAEYRKQKEAYKPITVDKHLECRIDVGTMLITDPNELDEQEIKTNRETYLLNLTRDNTQLLINEIWKLPTESVESSLMATLPAPTTILPRLRKPPTGKQLTKWEQFALEKGIKKKKKTNKVFDEVLDQWVPTYGFKHADAEKKKEWVIEVPKNADPNEDMFQKKKDLRSEKVAKNELQRLKNIARAKKEEIPRGGYLGPEAASSKDLQTAVTVAKYSTASVGKFQDKLPKEKEARGLGVKELIPGGKRKASHISDKPEKEADLELINSVLNKKPKLNTDKAISLQKHEERLEREISGDTGKSGKKGKGNSKSKKPRGHHGQRAPGKKAQAGRKRR